MVTNKTKIIGIVSVVYVVIACAVFSWVVYEVATAGKELSLRVDTIAEKNAKVKAYTAVSNLLKETTQERASLVEYVLQEDNTSAFLTEIEKIGTAQGVLLTTDSLSVVEKPGAANALVIHFSIEGSENVVKKMFSILETLPYHSTVSTLSLDRKKTGLTSAVVEVEITLRK